MRLAALADIRRSTLPAPHRATFPFSRAAPGLPARKGSRQAKGAR